MKHDRKLKAASPAAEQGARAPFSETTANTRALAAGSPEALSVRGALVLAAATLVAYAIFNYYRVGPELYLWSKTFASYDYRQHLGLSKRWLMQYGHAVFLFTLLVLSRYIFVGERFNETASKFLAVVVRYTIPIFIFHFPLLYFFASVTGHDPADPVDQAVLFVAVLVGCIVLGKLCSLGKPAFDRVGKGVTAFIEAREGMPDPARRPAPIRLARTHSEFLMFVRAAAALSVFLGHYSFAQFSSLEIPGFDNWRRWAIPFFFMVSGYFAMLALERRNSGPLAAIFHRYTSLWFMVVPMLLLVPVLDHIGFAAAPMLYMLNDTFVMHYQGELQGGPADLQAFLATLVNSLFYLNEIFLYNLLDLGTAHGGARAFSNDSFWFLCYLMPYMAMLAVMVKVRGGWKYFWLALMALFFGPPILMLAPLFFAGCLAYMIHKRV